VKPSIHGMQLEYCYLWHRHQSLLHFSGLRVRKATEVNSPSVGLLAYIGRIQYDTRQYYEVLFKTGNELKLTLCIQCYHIVIFNLKKYEYTL
jgi:hypothetical protein